jgi:hypothetical protein
LTAAEMREERKRLVCSSSIPQICKPWWNVLKIGDETWVCGYDPETKELSPQWKIPFSLCLKKYKYTAKSKWR